MTKDITIKGEFTIEGLEPQMNNFKQPLKYLKLRIGYEPPVFIDAMTSAKIKDDPKSELSEHNTNFPLNLKQDSPSDEVKDNWGNVITGDEKEIKGHLDKNY